METHRYRILVYHEDYYTNCSFFAKQFIETRYATPDVYIVPENISIKENYCPKNGIYFSHDLLFRMFEMFLTKGIKNEYSLDEIPLSDKSLRDYILSDKNIKLFGREI